MDKLELDNLEPLDQVKYINQEIKNSTISKVVKNIGIGRTTIRDRFIKIGYLYNKEINQYAQSNTTVIQLHQSNVKVPTKPRREPTNAYQTELIELAENKDALLEMLREYQRDAKVIDVPVLDITNLPIDLQKDVINKSIKIYKPVQDLFDNLCSQYLSHKKQDMLSLMIYEFYNRYKK